jgi:hypothetical protein
MLKSNNTQFNAVIFVVAVLTTALVMGPTLSMSGEAFAQKKYKNWSDCREDHSKKWCNNYFKKSNKNNNGNNANQGIGQSQSSNQNSQCVSGGSLGNSCNNLSIQNQENSGNNAAAQQGGGNGKSKGGNNANQGIGQSQSSNQNSQCVSGKDATVSCNNVQFQNQVNSGNNALSQIR